MSYETKDLSADEAAPIRLYRFAALSRNYLYTNDAESQVFLGSTYEPINIEDTSLEVGPASGSVRSFNIVVPYDCDLAEDFGGVTMPDRLELTAYRVHRGEDWTTEYKVMWKSKVVGIARQGRQLALICVGIAQSALASNMNSIYYQQSCNHRLFDERCKVSKVANTALSTVVIASDDAVEVFNDGWDDHGLRAGTIVNNRTQEQRLILDNVANIVAIGFPFYDILPGDEVQLIRGCNHSFSECGVKFSNIANYGGYPYVPDRNPFNGGI